MKAFLERVTPDIMFREETWKDLLFFALIEATDDLLPVRTDYNGETTNIGVNPLTSSRAMWYAGPDLVASVLLRESLPKSSTRFASFRSASSQVSGKLRYAAWSRLIRRQTIFSK